MNPEDLQLASFRGVPFFVTEASTSGGRRLVKKLFPNSDRQSIEDMGSSPREFTISGTVAARRDSSGSEITPYKQARDSILAALEARGPGVLIHPFLGRIERASVQTYTFRESTTSLGDSPIEITFAIDQGPPLPRAAPSVVGSVLDGSDEARDAVESDVAERFEVTDSFAGNFVDALEKIVEAGQKAVDVVLDVASGDGDVGEFARGADDFEGDAAEMAKDPDDLATRMVSLVEDAFDLYDDANDALLVMTKLFDFGDDDVAIQPTTAGLIERKRNRDVLNGAVQATALAKAYLAASRSELETVDDVDRASRVLEDQYQKIETAGLVGPEVLRRLKNLRVTTNEFFDQQRDVRPQIVEILTPLTSARVLAFQYYGSSDLGETIAKLNDLDDMRIEGRVRVLSS